jgi:pimeloyl-ACP methyl ester carboxylesterase
VSRPADFDANEAALMTNLRESGRIRAIRQMMTASKAGIEARLGEVKVPALVAMGASDPDFTDPKAEAERQAAALGGNNRVVMIDGAGHYPQIEQPEATAQAIADFVGVEVPVGA